MENIHTSPGHHEPQFDSKPIWRTFWILLGITLVELTLATIHLKTEFPPANHITQTRALITPASVYAVDSMNILTY